MAMLYSVYRGDHFLDVGTCTELCSRWGWHEEYMRKMATKSRHRCLGERALKVYRVGEEGQL